MSLIIFHHPAGRGHVTPSGHPERVARLDAVDAALDRLAGLERREASAVTRAALERAHEPAYLDDIYRGAPETGFRSLDPDTHMSAGSLAAAERAAGGNVDAVDLVMSGGAKAAFVATRPPGHHAERARAMGFCFFSNAAIAAHHAMAAHGAERVAIADFDVHHGNGSQDVFWEDPRVLFASSHQSPLYPGTGMESETGAGNIHNATLAPMSSPAAFHSAWEERLIPAIAAHRPDLLIISAGFDAHARDPLANLLLEDADFGRVTRRLCDLAEEVCGGRVVSTLEGGYDLEGLEGGLNAHLDELKDMAA